jgi:peptide/nickel transport system substrate-binding protein
MQFQFREVPNWQRAVTDVRIRRALVHALDRQALADTLTHGLGPPLHAFINPADPFFPDVDRAITKYPYDPARALALLNEAGWQRPGGGGLLTNAAGTTLDVEIWNSQEGGTERESILIADNWKAVGINASIYMIPAARDRDHEHRASFPAVTTNGRGLPLENFAYTSSNLPTPALRWQSPNRGSFQDPEVDRLHILGMTSLNDAERRQAIIALHQRVSDLVSIALLYSNPSLFIAKRRVQGPIGEGPVTAGLTWNVFEWRITD